ncbi:MAG: sarcosine oxidase subunit delta [Rhodospirillales bacterium]|jgi:sarcosine oxidase, subunit delta|nr:sarcosine oxidase subunit delta [Rhodospirillales bacterium]
MLLIECPWCGERDLTEFHCGGEGHIERPKEPDTLTDEQWGDYIFFRKNPKGVHHERWMHALGCRRWFNAVRDTVSDEFLAFYKTGEQPPEIDAKKEGGK